MMNHKIKSIIIILLLTCLVVPIQAEVGLVWSRDLSNSGSVRVTAVDINELGDIVYAGLSNGSIVSYDGDGNLLWIQSYTSSNITKIMTSESGSRLVALTADNSGTVYYINGINGVVNATVTASLPGNINNTAISRDGDYFFASGCNTLSIYHSSGQPYATNRTMMHNLTKWGPAAFDPSYQYVIAANSSNKVFRWSVTTYTGWPEMNWWKDTRNQSNIREDGFTYRLKFTSVNMSNYTMRFEPATNYSHTTSVSNCFEYSGFGSMFWFNNSTSSNCGMNFTIRNTSTLESAIVRGCWTLENRSFEIAAGNSEVYIYIGNTSYNYNTSEIDS